jgi:hypothetical protein
MAAALQSCTEVLDRVTQALNSSSSLGDGAHQQQLAQLRTQLNAAINQMPWSLRSFSSRARALLQAMSAALAALAAQRQPHSEAWMHLLASVLHVWTSVHAACSDSDDPSTLAQMKSWMQQQREWADGILRPVSACMYYPILQVDVLSHTTPPG